MTEQQDVLSPKRRRRHGNTILLGSIPVAVALTALLTAGTWAPAAPESQLADAPATPAVAAPEPMPSIVAPGTVADAVVASPLVTVVLPPPPKPEVKAVAVAASSPQKATSAPTQATVKKSAAKSSTAKKATAKKAPAKKAAPKKKAAKKVDFKAYCANPKKAYGASGGPKALLSAANKERARLGMKKLSWSSSLAGSATKWSKAMAAKDSKTKAKADALAHNPNRPGAENVAVSYVSTGLSQGGAISRAHSGWMNSNGHCLNIMNPAYSTMGAGAAKTKDGKSWYTTQNFR